MRGHKQMLSLYQAPHKVVFQWLVEPCPAWPWPASGQQIHKISWLDLKFYQQVRLKQIKSLYLETGDIVALTTNKAVAFFAGETSDSPTFLAIRDLFLKMILTFTSKLTFHRLTLGISTTTFSPAAAPALTRSARSASPAGPGDARSGGSAVSPLWAVQPARLPELFHLGCSRNSNNLEQSGDGETLRCY